MHLGSKAYFSAFRSKIDARDWMNVFLVEFFSALHLIFWNTLRQSSYPRASPTLSPGWNFMMNFEPSYNYSIMIVVGKLGESFKKNTTPIKDWVLTKSWNVSWAMSMVETWNELLKYFLQFFQGHGFCNKRIHSMH